MSIVSIASAAPADLVFVSVAIDGSCIGNPGPGGAAWYHDPTFRRSEHVRDTTNNRAELLALLRLLEDTAHWPYGLDVVSDSEYVVKAINEYLKGWKANGWRTSAGKPVKNRDLIEAIDCALVGRHIVLSWVRGHSGHPLQEEAHRLAEAAARWLAP